MHIFHEWSKWKPYMVCDDTKRVVRTEKRQYKKCRVCNKEVDVKISVVSMI